MFFSFNCFHVSKAVFFCAVHWISHHVPKPKTNRESSPRRPFPPVVNRISPLRAMYFSISLHSVFGFFFSFDSFLCYLLLILSVVRFLSIYLFFSAPFIAFPSHPETKKNKSKIQNPKSRSKSASALGRRSSFVPNPSYDEKLCCLSDFFFI